jgi:outer membrane protein assembly factor BamB
MIKRTLLMGLLLASPALATKTQFFAQSTRADFEGGTLDALVVTNFGELKLARAIESLIADEGKYASIDSIAEGLDGTLYVGTNASGLLLAVKDGKPTQLADFGESASVSALAVAPSGDLLVGVSGAIAKLQVLKAGTATPEVLVELPMAQYIWGIALAADGKIYLATGPNGELYEVDPTTKAAKVLFDSDEDNLRTVVSMNDMLFVGTDPNGLVLKLDRKTGKATVVFDAPENEVSTLLIDPRSGQLYAGTSQLVEPTENAGAAESAGHPTERVAGEPLFIEPSESPKPKPSEDEGNGELQVDHQPPKESADASDAERASDVPNTQPSSHGASPSGPITTVGGDEPAANGNAVYRIDSQGFVSEIFRDQSMVLAMARWENQLLIATGPTGTLYQLDLSSEEHSAIAKTRSQMLTSLLIASDKSVYVGSGLAATLSKLSAGLAKTGTFTSSVLDATQVSAFGKAQIRGAIAQDTSMTISTRSSNVSDEESPLWSEWSEPVPAARFTAIQTPPGRYVQYRLTLTGNGTTTPTLEDVSIAYQQPNVAPRIDSVTVTAEATEDGSPQPMRTISWVATEPNGDDLQYAIYQRSGAGSPWIQLAKDLTEVTWQWDTRKLSDGRYEVKVEASDTLANAAGTGKTVSRIAEAVQIDNTPPAIGDIKTTREGGKVTISLRVADRGGVVAGLEYSLDTEEHWQTVPPSDMLNDSPDEQYAIVLPDPGNAARVVSIRSRDESGNTAYESVTIRPESK